MSEPVHDCARCATPVRSLLVEGLDFSYFWFHCKKCNLKWAALRPPQKPIPQDPPR
jgi:hypothetical protein